MKLTKTLEMEIIDAYNDFWVANLSADMEKFSSYLVDDFSIFGSAVGEIFFGKNDAIGFYTATADQMRGKAELRNRERRVQPVEENSAVVCELSDLYVLINDVWTFYGHARISCVVTKINNEWKAVHQHASFPDHRTEEGQQIATEKIEKENLELREAVQRRTVELHAKNRELEIEAAVERVRAQSFAMQQTNDIAKVNREIFTQISKLKIDGFTGVAIYLVGDDGMVTVWDLSSPGSMSDVNSCAFRYDPEKTPTLSEFIPVWREGKTDYFIMDYPKERITLAADELEPYYPSMAESFRAAVASGALEHQWNLTARISGGILSLDMMKLPTDEVKSITLKMGAAFNLAYQRFHDLQNAEVQTREAQLELSLERIRAKVTAMKVSTDLLDIVVTMRTEFVALGHQADYFWHMRWQKDIYEKAMTAGDGSRIGNVMTLPRSIHANIPTIAAWEKTKEPTFVYAMDADAAVDYVYKMVTLGEFERVDPNAPTLDDIRHIGGLTFIMARTTHGEIGFSLPGSVPHPAEDAMATLVRFAAVFDLAYRRFEDLKSSEKQIREARIELALERVRARTMAMQHSDELADASFVLDTQVRSLGIQTRGCAFNIYGENESTEWFSSEGGMLPPYKTPREDFFLRAYHAGKNGQSLYIEEFTRETCKAHYEYLMTIPVMGDALRGMITSGLKFPERQIDYAVFFKYGYVLFITLEPVPDAEEVFIRFAKVFEQTYTRFLDLQKSEAQTLRAEQDLLEIKAARKKAEETLLELQDTQKQLIQAEKMASLGELTAGIAHEIQNPLNFVNNFSEVNQELAEELKEELAAGNVQLANEIADDIRDNSEKINHHGKRADGIVKGMLQHSQSGKGQKEATDINALCDEYLRLAYHGLRAKDKSFNATLKTEFDERIGKINIVPQDFGRVILNLLTNAFYAVNLRGFQNPGGLPSTSGRFEPYEPTVTIATKKIAGKVEIRVSDNGNGIPQNILDKIFQPFFTTKPTGQGTGLGLSLAYDIVKAHGGELKVETEEGEGTTFIIQLTAIC